MTTPRLISAFVLAAVSSTAACGIGSVSPIVTDADVAYDAGLEGRWFEAVDRDSATIVAAGENSYRITYTDGGSGKSGHFAARLGTIGAFRVLDVQPEDAAPNASDLYRGLVLRAHSLLVIEEISATTIRFRMIEHDSLTRFLERNPNATAHALLKDGVLLTGPTPAVRKFLGEFLGRRGSLGNAATWRR